MTHICGQTKDGKFRVQRKTIRKRLTEKLQAVKLELRKRMHEPISVQGRWVGAVIRGYFGYHAIPGNMHALAGPPHEKQKPHAGSGSHTAHVVKVSCFYTTGALTAACSGLGVAALNSTTTSSKVVFRLKKLVDGFL